jgi:hypothetical protein
VTLQHAQTALHGFANEAAQQEPPQSDVLIGIIHQERELGLFGTIAMKAPTATMGRSAARSGTATNATRWTWSTAASR